MNETKNRRDSKVETVQGMQAEAAGSHAPNELPSVVEGLELTSVFQPVVSLSHRRVVGHEALLRATDAAGRSVAPFELFRAAERAGESSALDRCSRARHVAQFRGLSIPAGDQWLFLNVQMDPLVAPEAAASALSDLLRAHGLEPWRVVIEVLESAVEDEDLLAQTVASYRAAGCLIALDDFGAGHSNFDRIWRLRPEIVKLDRSLVARAARDSQAERILPNLVALIHESGSLSLMEGIETHSEALIAVDSAVDLVQGYYFARPAEEPDRKGAEEAAGEAVRRGRQRQISHRNKRREALSSYLYAFERTAGLLASGLPFKPACVRLLRRDGVLRCFLLDLDGYQAAPNLESSTGRARTRDRRFAPLSDARRADWSRRDYYRRAIEQPGKPQVSRPYLSLADAALCVTLSAAVEVEEQLVVLCCDLAYPFGAVPGLAR